MKVADKRNGEQKKKLITYVSLKYTLTINSNLKAKNMTITEFLCI